MSHDQVRPNGIGNVHSDFVSRGVLFDVAHSQGVECLEPGCPIKAGDLETAERAQGVLVGHATTCWCAPARCRRSATTTMGRCSTEARRVLDDVMIPFHMLALCNLGIRLGEFWYLQEIAADCANDGCYKFMLVAQGFPITGGTGTPVNPLAMK